MMIESRDREKVCLMMRNSTVMMRYSSTIMIWRIESGKIMMDELIDNNQVVDVN